MSDNKVKWITQVSDKTCFTVLKNTALVSFSRGISFSNNSHDSPSGVSNMCVKAKL